MQPKKCGTAKKVWKKLDKNADSVCVCLAHLFSVVIMVLIRKLFTKECTVYIAISS